MKKKFLRRLLIIIILLIVNNMNTTDAVSSTSEDSNIVNSEEIAYSILNFGADQTGNEDCTDAILEALSVYDELYFPEGKYRISEPLKIDKSIKWIGENAEIILDDSQFNGASIEQPSTFILMFKNNVDLEGIDFICQSHNNEAYADGETIVENYKYARIAIKIVGGIDHKIKNCNFYISNYSDDVPARISGIWFQFDTKTDNEENEENRKIIIEDCIISNQATGWKTGQSCVWVTGNAKDVDIINCTIEKKHIGDTVVFWGWPNATNVEGEAQKQKIENINIDNCIFNITDDKSQMGAACVNFGNEVDGTEFSTINIKNTNFNVGKGLKRPCIGMSSCSGITVNLENCNFIKKECEYKEDGSIDTLDKLNVFFIATDDCEAELNNCKIENLLTVTNLSERSYNIKNSSEMKFNNCEVLTRTFIYSYVTSSFNNCSFTTTRVDPDNGIMKKIKFYLGNELTETNDDKKIIKNNPNKFENCIFNCPTQISGNVSAIGCSFKYPMDICFLEKSDEFRKNDNIKIEDCNFDDTFNIKTDYAVNNIQIQNNTFVKGVNYSIKNDDNTYHTNQYDDLNILLNSNGQIGYVNLDGTRLNFVNQNVKGKVEVEKTGENLKLGEGTFYYEDKPLSRVEIAISVNEDIRTLDPVTLDLVTRYEEGDLIASDITNEEGKITFDDLYLGKYMVKEIKTIDDYVLDKEEHNVELTESEDSRVYEVVRLKNNLKKGNLEFTQLDLMNGKVIPNTIIEVYTENNELVFSGKTDENGKVIIEGMKVGKYYIKEKKSAEGYLVSDEIITFEIKEDNETIKAEMKNIHISEGVLERHIDIISKEVLYSEIHKGNEGDNYTTNRKEFDGYDIVEENLPSNAEGKMEVDEIQVNYYYIRKATVVVRYIDKTTGREIEQKTINGHEGDKYRTEEKQIPYYKLIDKTDNTEGEMKVDKIEQEDGTEIINSEILVNYYYEPLKFNLKVDKKISKIEVNGIEKAITDGELENIKIDKDKLNTETIKVEYLIEVINNGEISGKATLIEKIPEGFEMKSIDNEEWKIENEVAKIEIDSIEPEEEKEYKVVLEWKKGENNIGTKENIAYVDEIENVAQYKEITEEDNTDGATLVLSITVDKELVIENYEKTEENKVKYIERIKPETTIEEFLNSIKTNGTVEVYQENTQITDFRRKIATGLTIKIAWETDEETYTLVVTGDLNGDGEMGDIDLLRLVRYNAGLDTNLSGAYLKASDIYKDGACADNKDLLKIARVLAGLEGL